MQLIDVTNSYSRMIQHELVKSPVHFIKVYTLGNSKVVYKKKHAFSEIVISNKIRQITPKEIEFVKTKLLKDRADAATVTAQGNKFGELIPRNLVSYLTGFFIIKY